MSHRFCRKKDSLDVHILTDALLAAGCVECDPKGRIPETIVQPAEDSQAPETGTPDAGAPPKDAPGKDAPPKDAPPAATKAPKARGGRPKKDKASDKTEPPQA